MSAQHPALPAEPKLVFVGSDTRVTPAADAAREGHRVVDLEALGAGVFAGATAAIIDIDLGDAPARQKLRSAIGSLRQHPPLIFAVDRGPALHLQATQANALGASTVIKRPVNAEGIRAALVDLGLGEQPPRPVAQPRRPEAGWSSIAAAHQLIGASFTALSSGGRLDIAEAESASRELFSGIGQAGLQGWLEIVRAHHAGTFQHCLLVTGAVVAYVAHVEMSDQMQRDLSVAALLHDIGKAEIPNAILDKPGKLTAAEFALVQRHPRIGADYLRQNTSLRPEIIEPVLHHHEFLDGSGYPDRLAGAQIPLTTRIMTVCDIYGALVEERSYKKPSTPAEALYVLIGMAQAGKVDFGVVRKLATALGVDLPAMARQG